MPWNDQHNCNYRREFENHGRSNRKRRDKTIPFSVKEYLRSIGINDNKVSFFSIQDELTNSYLARACLLYMVQFDGISVTEKTSKDHPLATYSAQYWSMHARIAVLAVQFDFTLEKQIDQLFASSTKLLTWIRLCNPDHEKPQYDALIDDIAPPLCLNMWLISSSKVTHRPGRKR